MNLSIEHPETNQSALRHDPSTGDSESIWLKLVLAVNLAFGVPFCLFLAASHSAPLVLMCCGGGLCVAYLIVALMSLLEFAAAWREPKCPQVDVEKSPKCSVIVSAYLPNEQDVVIDTVLHLLTQLDAPGASVDGHPSDLLRRQQVQVILAYNTPISLPVQAELERIAAEYPSFIALHAPGSLSKAENINAAKRIATGDVIALFDADHRPEPDCLVRACRWIDAGYDIVQGRSFVRNASQNLLARLIAVEFDLIYALAHQGRSNLGNTAIFAGANAYWRREALLAFDLDAKALTEDIDVSLRALMSGVRIVHDRRIISSELAPTRFADWFTQRKRWSQGWTEATLKHSLSMTKSPALTLRQRILWFYWLSWREIFHDIGLLIVPFTAALLCTGEPGMHSPQFYVPFAISLFVLELAVLVTWFICRRNRAAGPSASFPTYVLYGITAPIYETLKTTVAVVAQIGHLIGDRRWIVTRRSTFESTPSSPIPKMRRRWSTGLISAAVICGLIASFDLVLGGAGLIRQRDLDRAVDATVQRYRTVSYVDYNVQELDEGGQEFDTIYHGGGATDDEIVGAIKDYDVPGWSASLWQGKNRTRLPRLPDWSTSVALAVEPSDKVVVGYAENGSGQSMAVRWSNGSVTTMPANSSYATSVATAVSPSGLIVGRAMNGDDGTADWYSVDSRAFLWSDSHVTLLPLPSECLNARAYGVNDDGLVVGWALTRANRMQAAAWVGGAAHLLGTLPGGHVSAAVAVDGAGVIVGDSDDANGLLHTVRWENGEIEDLGLPGGSDWCKPVCLGADGTIYGDAGGRSHVGNWRCYAWNRATGMRLIRIPLDAGLVPQRLIGVRPNGDLIAVGASRNDVDRDDERLLLLSPVRR